MFSNSAPVGCKVDGECIGQIQVRVSFILHLIIVFLKCHYNTFRAFWRARERLIQDRFQWLVVAFGLHVASVGVLVKFLK